MGTLTQDIARLCGEITALQGARQAFMTDVAKQTGEMKAEVASMRSGFRKSHAKMAAQTRALQKKFVSNLVSNVSGLQAGFQKAHADMAANTRQDRAKFVAGMTTDVRRTLTGFDKAHEEMARRTKRKTQIS